MNTSDTWSIRDLKGTIEMVTAGINAAPGVPDAFKEAIKGCYPIDAQGVIVHAFSVKHGDKIIIQIDVTKLF